MCGLECRVHGAVGVVYERFRMFHGKHAKQMTTRAHLRYAVEWQASGYFVDGIESHGHGLHVVRASRRGRETAGERERERKRAYMQVRMTHACECV